MNGDRIARFLPIALLAAVATALLATPMARFLGPTTALTTLLSLVALAALAAGIFVAPGRRYGALILVSWAALSAACIIADATPTATVALQQLLLVLASALASHRPALAIRLPMACLSLAAWSWTFNYTGSVGLSTWAWMLAHGFSHGLDALPHRQADTWDSARKRVQSSLGKLHQ